MADWRPDLLIIDGDFFDFYYMSRFAEHDVAFDKADALSTDYRRGREELDFFLSVCGKVMFREGNHEFRLQKRREKYPELWSLLEIDKQLELADRGIEYSSELDEPIQLGPQLAVTHGWYYNKYHTNKTLIEYGGSVIYGHVHHHQLDSRYVKADKRVITVFSNPCLTDVDPEFFKGRPTRHTNGFTTLYMDRSGFFYPTIIQMNDNSFIFEGRRY